MKHFLLLLTSLLLLTPQLRAMDYEEARQQAWYLTDKMAYELNLTEEQCDRAYEINLDYLLNVRTADELYGTYWTYRNADLRCILFDWQYNLYAATSYFFRPLNWVRSRWYFPVWNHYATNHYYFRRPVIVNVYHGRIGVPRGPRSPYYNVTLRRSPGMRDHYIRGGGRMPQHTSTPRIENRRPGLSGTIQHGPNGTREWRNPGQQTERPAGRPQNNTGNYGNGDRRPSQAARPSRPGTSVVTSSAGNRRESVVSQPRQGASNASQSRVRGTMGTQQRPTGSSSNTRSYRGSH